MVLSMEITAYSPTVAECDASPLVTASGKRVYVGGIAADLRVLPFGSQVIIPNYNNGDPCTVIDTGGAIHGLKLDVFFWHSNDAVQWGRRKNVRVEVLYVPGRKQ
jgi:3D (Asp-Asp-Asp) domain-containing protein